MEEDSFGLLVRQVGGMVRKPRIMCGLSTALQPQGRYLKARLAITLSIRANGQIIAAPLDLHRSTGRAHC
jgi:hypothetical protein